MGAAHSGEGLPPPGVFLPEQGTGRRDGAAGAAWQSPFGCDSAARACCEKKSVAGGDIRIAHNRPVLSKDQRQLDRRGVVPAPPPHWVQHTAESGLATPRLPHGGRSASHGASLWPPASVTTPDLRAESRRERSRPGVWADVDGPDVHNQPAWHPHPRAYLPRSMNTLEDIVELPTPDDEGGGLAVTLADNVQSLVQPPNASSPRPRPRTHEVKPVLHDVTASQSDFKQASRMLLAQQKQHNDAFRQYNQNCGTIQDANERIQLVAESESNQARRAVRIMDEYSRASAPAPEWSVRSTRRPDGIRHEPKQSVREAGTRWEDLSPYQRENRIDDISQEATSQYRDARWNDRLFDQIK